MYKAALALDHIGSILTVYMYVYNIHNIYTYWTLYPLFLGWTINIDIYFGPFSRNLLHLWRTLRFKCPCSLGMFQPCFDFPRVRCLADFPIFIGHQEHFPYFPMVFPIFSYFPIFFPMFSQGFLPSQDSQGQNPTVVSVSPPMRRIPLPGTTTGRIVMDGQTGNGPRCAGRILRFLRGAKRFPNDTLWDFHGSLWWSIGILWWSIPSGKRLHFANLKMAQSK